MTITTFTGADVILPDRVAGGSVGVANGRFVEPGRAGETFDLAGHFLCPGFVDLHVHGGGGADFMDLTADAFRTSCRTHARHGTTSLTPTSTTGTRAEYDEFLALCREFRTTDTGGARVVGSHLYGPYFFPLARGCHPAADFRTSAVGDANEYAGFDAAFPLTVTIAPELPDALALAAECRRRGVRVNIGHSYATYEQVEAAVAAGAGHVDHLFCAMSDRARLRLEQPFPMRAGVAEATLAMPELTTEVIADGKHLADGLLRAAYRIKGSDRLALVTDSMRAVDEPDGEYWFGRVGTGTRVRKHDGVGKTLDLAGLASSVVGMDACVRVMLRATGAPLHEVVRMASLTPARIIGLDAEIGSIEPGKRADFVVLDRALQVRQVYVGGVRVV